MRLLIAGLNFAPEPTGVGRYTGDMAAWLAARGHVVSVVTTPAHYPEWRIRPGMTRRAWRRESVDGCAVVRCPIFVPRQPVGWRRALHSASFGLSSLPAIAAEAARFRPDIVLSVVPTLSSAPAALGAARAAGALAWLHVQDFELDIAQATAGKPEASAALRHGLGRLEGWGMRRFDLVSTISGRMLDRLGERGVAESRRFLFPNWVDTGRIRPMSPSPERRRQFGLPPSGCIAMFSGSMGRKLGLETLIEAARLVGPEVYFVLVGAGPERARIERAAAGLANVRLMPLQPETALNDLLGCADVHLLPQRSGIGDLVMPSKLGAMLASGKPVVALAEARTQVASFVEGCGIVVPPEQPHSLAAAVRRLAGDAAERARLGAAARRIALQMLDREAVLLRAEARLAAALAARQRREPSLAPL